MALTSSWASHGWFRGLFVAWAILALFVVWRQSQVVLDRRFKQQGIASSSELVIPKIIHQSWKTAERIPSKFVPWMQSWQRFHPSWTYMFWDDDDNIKLFQVHFPQYLSVATAMSKIELADMARVALLYLYGGVYVDSDFECLRAFDDLRHLSLFLSAEPRVHAILLESLETPRLWNAILASQPRHPFWIAILDAIQANFNAYRDTSDPIALTGPGAFDPTYADWPDKDSVVVLPEEYFYPEFSAWLVPNMTATCESSKHIPAVASACTWLNQHPQGHKTSNTHAVHRWQCTWCGRGSKANESFTTLADAAPNHARPKW
ncbi:hypothetical protein AC1031_009409 [Aphanomyces cochlioides]|nr:hypothetical protein AC1031_009409 [Aphanomyces cochlioides]